MWSSYRPCPNSSPRRWLNLIAVGPYLWDHTRYPDVLGDLTEARGIVLTAFKFPFISQVSLWDVSPWLAIAATVLWLGWMSNTINWSDGLDGMVAGISLIAALMLAIHAWRLGQLTIALLPLALAGVCVGFLLFNFRRSAHLYGRQRRRGAGLLAGRLRDHRRGQAGHRAAGSWACRSWISPG